MFRKAILNGILQQSFNSESRVEIDSNFLQEEEAKNKDEENKKEIVNIEKDEKEKLSVNNNCSLEVELGRVQTYVKDENKEIKETETEKLLKEERSKEYDISPVWNNIKEEKEEIVEDKKEIVKLLKDGICEENNISLVNKNSSGLIDDANSLDDVYSNYSIRKVKDYVNETNCSDKELDDLIATLKSKKEKTLEEIVLLQKLQARRRSRKSRNKKIANMTEEQIKARKEFLRKKQQITRANETQEQKEVRKRKNREKRKKAYQKLTEEEKKQKMNFKYCDLCDFKALQWGNLREHTEHVHKNEFFACDQCVRTFSRKSYLRNHISFAHENRKFLCDQCDKKYSTKSMLNKHIKSIHKNVYFFCDKCGHKAKTSGDLKNHNDSVQCRVNMIFKKRQMET